MNSNGKYPRFVITGLWRVLSYTNPFIHELRVNDLNKDAFLEVKFDFQIMLAAAIHSVKNTESPPRIEMTSGW